jgi:hypothetical protein
MNISSLGKIIIVQDLDLLLLNLRGIKTFISYKIIFKFIKQIHN